MQLLNTLYLTTPDTYLRLDNETLRVEVDHETRLRVPLHHLSAVVCFGYIGLSAPLMHRLAEAGIALVLLDDNGRFKARLEGSVSGNVLLRQAQFQRVADASFTLDMARACVAGKIKNTRQVLQRGAREAKAGDEARTLDGWLTTWPPACVPCPLQPAWTLCAGWRARPPASTSAA